jgi:3-oxoacyl-[acyl-carrier-protein] synthase II
VGLALAGVDSVERFLDTTVPTPAPDWAPEARLGRRGWRYKDRATRLALAAAKEAVEMALPAAPPGPFPRTGVVASSNLGNLDTVCRVAAQLKNGTSSDTSPLDLPNASSNVVASTVAAWFGFKGPNLMLCNGATSGIDALYTASVVIQSGRADRMVVVGVEPGTREASRFMDDCARHWLGGVDGLRWGEGAAAVVLESWHAAAKRRDRIWARLGRFQTSPEDGLSKSLRALGSEPPALWLTPSRQYAPTREAVDKARAHWPDGGTEEKDLACVLGEMYGASGVLQAVVACLWLSRSQGGWAALTSGGFAGDGFASCGLHAGWTGEKGASPEAGVA